MTSEQCGTQINVQHCRLACSVTRTAVVGGKRRFCFPHRKVFHTKRFGCSGFVFAVIGFNRLTATSRLPDLADLHSVHVQCTTVRARKLQLMFSSPSFDYQI